MKQLFRILVIISTITYISFIGLPLIDKYYLNQQAIDVLAWNGYGAIIKLPNWVNWFSNFIWLPLAIGLWFFNSFARTAFLVLTILFLFLFPFQGLFIVSGFEMLLFQATTLLDGVILTMAYFTSLDEQFKKT